MPSRSDQLHSYQYAQQRVVSALVGHDPDPGRSPLRRAGTTALVSLLVAAIAVGGFAVYGLFTGNDRANVTDGSVVLAEKGSGARYVYTKADGRLHPVLNYTSGLLVATGTEPAVRTTTRRRLATVPLGEPLGIPGAPDSLPTRKELLPGRWTVCTAPGDAGPQSTLLVGGEPADGAAPAAPAPGQPGQGLFVTAAGRSWLVYGNRRFFVPDADALRNFAWNGQQPWPVDEAWINAVPAGPDLRPPATPGTGPSAAAPYRVGDLLKVDGGRYAVVLPDGKAALTPMQGALLEARGGTVRALDAAGYGRVPDSATQLSDAGAAGGLPAAMPTLAAPTRSLCLTVAGTATTVAAERIRVDATVPAAVPVPRPPGDLAVRADAVAVPRGRGALVSVAASPSAPADGGTVCLVTDAGTAFPLASRDLLGRLGYGGAPVVRMPGQLVGLLPAGPSLDAERARRPATAPAGG